MVKTKSGKIKILIVDDHSMLIDGLKDILDEQKDMEVIGATGDGQECIAMAKKLSPDIVLMDINLPGMTGITATRLIKKEAPAIKILMISSYDDDLHIIESFQAGADGYIPKSYHVTKMIEAIRQVEEKGSFVTDNVVSKLIRNLRDLPSATVSASASFGLTPTEIKVLDAIKDGKQTKEAAVVLKVKEKSVRNHLNSIYSKLDVNNRVRAIELAIKKGIIARD